jgi:3',5'-cyclic AMP phosphodiesterase CpdA
MFRLAHLSDPHLGPLPTPRMRDLASKRLTGYVNWRRGRNRAHDMPLLDAIVADLRAQNPDHIACTGDLVNIGLHAEYPGARAFMEKLGPGDRVSFVPGNHDAYVRTSMRDIERYLSPWMTSDTGRFEGFPYVRLVGPMALVGLSSAVPTAPFIASGTLGPAQRQALARILTFLGTQPLARVVMIHHPPHRAGSRTGRGLTDAGALEEVLGKAGAELVLHGHNHTISVMRIDGPSGMIPVVGAPSASSIGSHYSHRAGYHLFEIDLTPQGITMSARTRGLRQDGSIGDLGSLPLTSAYDAVLAEDRAIRD